jgi:uracil-DNA glycosylase family 4
VENRLDYIQVPGEGPLDCKICIVGEAPGKHEADQHKPFVGTSGQELTKMLHQAGLIRNEIYLTNVIKEQPKGNDIELFVELTSKHQRITNAKTNAYLYYLEEELASCQANVFVPMGNTALWALTGLVGILKWRGSILESTLLPGRKVIPTIHPRAVLPPTGVYLWRYLINYDLVRARKESTTSELNYPELELRVGPDYFTTIEFLSAANEATIVDIDIETSHDQVSCFGLSFEENIALCIPFVGDNGNYWHPEQEMEIWRLIAKLMENPEVKKRGQNILFDAYFLLHRHGIRTVNIIDTMIAQGIAYPDFPKGLDFITSIYTRIPYYKDEGKKWNRLPGDWKQLWYYNCKDVLATQAAWPELKKELERQKNIGTYVRQALLVEPLAFMQERGIKMDYLALASASESVDKEISELTNRFYGCCGSEVNPNSPKQLKEYFYVKKGFTPYRNRKTGGESVNADALKRLARKGVVEAQILLEIRKLSKLKGTYLDVILDPDNRLRCSFNPVGTESGRLSSSQTIFGTGCLPPEAEVLTDFGWLPIPQVLPKDRIAQWSPHDGKITFTQSIPFETDFEGNLFYAKTEQFEIMLTPEHRVISQKPGCKDWRVYSAQDTANMSVSNIPTSGSYIQGELTFSYPRLLTAILADGSYENNKVRVSFKKARKIERILQLFELYGVEYTEQICSREGYRRFAFLRPTDWPEKKWDSWILYLDPTTADEMVDEARYWDAHQRGDSFIFFTSKREQASWFMTLCHLTGKGTTLRREEQNEGSYSDTVMWVVNVKPRSFVNVMSKHWTQVPYKGKVYCVTVPTKYFLVRFRDCISITGNTNLQNIPYEVRRFMLFDEDYIGYNIDLSQAENRIVAYVGPVDEMINAFETKQDVHKLTASLIYKKAISDITPDERQWGKRANHGLNYDLGYRFFALYYEIGEAEAKYIVDRYHQAYPGVRQSYHSQVRSMLSQTRTVVNCMGRRRIFLDRWGDDLFKSAYSFIPQSTVADVINERGLEYIYYNQDLFPSIELLLQIHDSIVFQIPKSVPLEQHAEMVWKIKQQLEIPLHWKTQTFIIPAEIQVSTGHLGKGLGGLKDIKASSEAELLVALREL